MIEFLNFQNEPTYRIFQWLDKTQDIEALIRNAVAAAKEKVEATTLPQLFSERFAIADELAELIGDLTDDLLTSAANKCGIDIEMHKDCQGDEDCLAALLGDALASVQYQIVAKALLIKAAGRKPSIN